jgi:hypothetical protein
MVESPSASIDRHEKWQGVNGQREDDPAEHANSSDVKEKPKGKHGGGSTRVDSSHGRAFHRHRGRTIGCKGETRVVAAMQLRLAWC